MLVPDAFELRMRYPGIAALQLAFLSHLKRRVLAVVDYSVPVLFLITITGYLPLAAAEGCADGIYR